MSKGQLTTGEHPSIQELVDEFSLYLETFSDNAPGTITEQSCIINFRAGTTKVMGDQWNEGVREYFATLHSYLRSSNFDLVEINTSPTDTLQNILNAAREKPVRFFTSEIRKLERYSDENEKEIPGKIVKHYRSLLKTHSDKFLELEKLFDLFAKRIDKDQSLNFKLSDDEILEIVKDMNNGRLLAPKKKNRFEMLFEVAHMAMYRDDEQKQEDVKDSPTSYYGKQSSMHRASSSSDFGCVIGSPLKILMGEAGIFESGD